MSGKITTKVEITEKLAKGYKIKEIYEIASENKSPKFSLWTVRYETDYPTNFCDRFGEFRSCTECKWFVIDKEVMRKGECVSKHGHCARSLDHCIFGAVIEAIELARAHGCEVRVW